MKRYGRVRRMMTFWDILYLYLYHYISLQSMKTIDRCNGRYGVDSEGVLSFAITLFGEEKSFATVLFVRLLIM